MLGITKISDADYYLRSGCQHESHVADPAGYQLDAIQRGEPPGFWAPRGANTFGLAGAIHAESPSGEKFRTVLNKLQHPDTGEQLGKAPPQFKTAEQRVAAFQRKYPQATPEQVQAARVKAEGDHRESVHGLDLTFSAAKSWSLLHAALEREGRPEEAREVMAAWMDGVSAALDQVHDEFNIGRKGTAGPKVAGRSTTRVERGQDMVLAVFPHLVSRDSEPQVHAHAVLVNRILMPDGTWQALHAQALMKSKHLLDATCTRTAEASLAQRLPWVRLATRPDGKAREVVGIDEGVRDLFSSRTRALTGWEQEMVNTFHDIHGRQPSAIEKWRMQRHAALKDRKAKPAVAPTREQRLAEWEQAAAEEVAGGFDGLLRDVERAGETDPPDPTFDPDLVAQQALADLEQRKATWNRSHLYFAISQHLPDMLAIEPARVTGLLTELTDQALKSPQVVSLMAPAVAAAPPSLRDEKSGRSVFDAPATDRFTTAKHLAREDSLVARLDRRGAPVVTHAEAERALGGFDLSDEQMRVGVDILTSDRGLQLVNASAGTGKSRLMAALSTASERLHGHGLTGFTTAQNAAEVLAAEGVSRAHNIARFLNFDERDLRGETSEVERIEFAVPRGGTVVFDEASMISTPDATRVLNVLDRRGVGRVVLVGDTAQVDAVDAGGGFSMLVDEAQRREPDTARVHQLETVRRFTNDWERDASTQVREGDPQALTAYDSRARIRGGDTPEQVREQAVRALVTDVLSGRDSILVAVSTEEAAALSSQVRQSLAEHGHVEHEGVALHDDTTAGVGDIVQTRLNDRQLEGGAVFNREQWQVVGRDDEGGLTVRRAQDRDEHGERQWGEPRTLPASYVAAHVELAYSGTVHAVQGRTTDTAHVLVDQGMGRSQLYPAMTRGRDGNWLWVSPDADRAEKVEQAQERVTELTARASEQVGTHRGPSAQGQLAEAQGRLAELLASGQFPLGRLADIVAQDDHDMAARTAIVEEQEHSTHLGHLGPQYTSVLTEHRAAEHRGMILEVLGPDGQAVVGDDAASGLFSLLRQAETTGHNPRELVGRVVGRGGGLSGAHSPASVLHARLEKEMGQALYGDARRPFTYVDRVPTRANSPQELERLRFATETAKAMDGRAAVLGQRAVDDAPQWLIDWRGPVPSEPQERESFAAQAAPIAAYREQYGWHDEKRAIGPQPGKGEPERSWVWNRAADVLGMDPKEREMSALSTGELANRQQDWDRQLSWMPRNVDEDLREAHLAREEARLQEVEARTRGEDSTDREMDAAIMGQRVDQLEEVAGVRATAYEATTETRERAEEARAEVERRGEIEQARAGEPLPDEPEADDKAQEPAAKPEPEREDAEAPEPAVDPATPEPEVDRGAQLRADLAQARAAAQILADRQEAQQQPDETAPTTPEPQVDRELSD